MTWRNDLDIGKKVEKAWLNRIMVAFGDARQTFGEDCRFDLEVPELGISIEVKFDPRSQETGNVVLEYFHGKPSGILTSQATHWLFDLGDQQIWMTRERLLEFVFRESPQPVKIHGPGDGKPKMVFLVPRDDLIRYSNRAESSTA
tara:strand:+ start:9999 stop:10433 length:435 start_codon:yes stop_codon:yes gene_type:complete